MNDKNINSHDTKNNSHDARRTTHNNQKPRLLIVDDDEGVLKQLKWSLKDEYDVLIASTKEEALSLAKTQSPELITLDVNLNGTAAFSKDGIDILDEIKNSGLICKIIMVTGNETKEIALEAIEKGAFDYYLKPVNIDELKIMLRRALYILGLEKENKELAIQLQDSFKFQDLIGSSAAMEEVFKLVRRVSSTDVNVLVTGESGTGKELVARAIYHLSPRKDKPFVVINCGAIPENLLESELFGHEKGSFTDAHVKKIGKLELANSGTVFLDEIGEMSLGLQVKILRFLQERVIERVGGGSPIELDVRVVAATNSDLAKRIEDGTFREDLYYRLSVINVNLPPLRERSDDVFLLARYFLNKYKNEVNAQNIKGFSKEAKDALRSYGWPGNVREMENKVRRAIILAEDSFITPSELGFSKDDKAKLNIGRLSLKEARQGIEIEFIKKALKEANGNVSVAAKMLDITRPTLYDLIKKYGITT